MIFIVYCFLHKQLTPVKLPLFLDLFEISIVMFLLFALTCSIEKETGPPHEKKFICSVQIATVDGVLYMKGDEKTKVKEAENSAASQMIRALQESTFTSNKDVI